MVFNDSVMLESEKIIFALRELFLKGGFVPYRMSKFEEYDLYAKNKEFLVSDNVITFAGAGGKLMALKPDVTLSIIKNSKDTPDLLQKVFYNENVYRYSKEARTFKEMMQTGVEAFGKVDIDVVCDTVLLAAQSLKVLTSDYVIALSNLDILNLLFNASNDYDNKDLLNAVTKKNDDYLSGSADSKEIAILRELIGVSGSVKDALGKIKDILSGIEGFVDESRFLTLLEKLSKSEFAEKIVVDFSETDDMNYYNGTVFKGYVSGVSGAVLSGGQYDKLMRKMGRRSNAVGFAVYTDKLENVAERCEKAAADKDFINIAIPKGRLGKKVLKILNKAGVNCPDDPDDNRKLIFEDKNSRARFFWVKPTDVEKYVEKGVADIGVAGKDILLEYEPDVYEISDLKIGKCRMAVAAPKGFKDDPNKTLVVATKFENIANKYYRKLGREIEVIHLNGSIEVAPILGLSDIIVDIVETGTTLKENDLEVIEEIIDISARLIANKTSFKFKNELLTNLFEKIAEVTEEKS
ncbi:MAG: ATP phosphoribosyltransferase [Clostridia bacterium]|nr:ATP phosphoribosyltransferase [Clostridia bacterium]